MPEILKTGFFLVQGLYHYYIHVFSNLKIDQCVGFPIANSKRRFSTRLLKNFKYYVRESRWGTSEISNQ